MDRLELPSCLDSSRRVLVAGAGGGFDVYAGLPIWHRLKRAGKQVFLANLSFTHLAGSDACALTPSLFAVGPDTTGCDDYFPERALARFLSSSGESGSVYTLDKTGVAPTRDAYAYLVRELDLDAIILVDGGTDILMTGDEAGLGTPTEDMTSLAAVAALEQVETRLVCCLGFGIDAHHGVCHAHFLENVAALSRERAFLGSIALLPSMPESQLYLDAVEHAEAAIPARTSIVNGCIAAALEGQFGDYHRTERTRGSRLFINPLMTLYWMFDLPAVARRNLYLPMLESTRSVWEVQVVIEAFRHAVRQRPRTSIPH